MKISGGTTFGNWATGRPTSVTSPTMTIMMDITMATIGRLMKNFDIGLFGWRSGNGHGYRLRRCIGRVHNSPFTNFLNPFNHNTLARVETLLNNPECPTAFAHTDGLDMNLVVCWHDGD